MKVPKKSSRKSAPKPSDLGAAKDSRGGVYQVIGTMVTPIQVSAPPFSSYTFSKPK